MTLLATTRRVLLAAAALLLAACSPEDARRAATAATELRASTESSITLFAALQARAKKEPAAWAGAVHPVNGVVRDQFERARNATAYANLTPADRARQVRDLLPGPETPLMEVSLRRFQPALARAGLIESTALAYAKAWPLGTDVLACMREHVIAYGKSMREGALLLNPPTESKAAGPLYQRLDNEVADLTLPLQQAVVGNDRLAAAAAVERIKLRVDEERGENARVQLAFARSAEAAGALVKALDQATTINFAGLLASAQSLLPGLSVVASPADIQSGLRTLGAIGGRLDEDSWLASLAAQPLGQVQCTTP